MIIAIVLLQGCTKNDVNYCNDTYVMDKFLSVNDNGIYYSERGIAYYYDFNAEVSIPLCTKINCNHEGRSPQNMKPSCDAYLYEHIECMAVIGDSLYYVSVPDDESYFVKEFYKADKNGKNRVLLCRRENMAFLSFKRFEDGYLLYAYYNSEDQNGQLLEKNEVGIGALNLETGEMLEVNIEDAYNAQIFWVSMEDSYIYYVIGYSTLDLKKYSYSELAANIDKNGETIYSTEMWRYDISSGDKEIYYEKETDDGTMMVGYGHFFVSQNNNTKYLMRDLKECKEFIFDSKFDKCSYNMFYDGIVFTGKNEIFLLEYDSDEIRMIGKNDVNYGLSVKCMTDNWVFGEIYRDGTCKYVYCPKNEFMNGIYDWREFIMSY